LHRAPARARASGLLELRLSRMSAEATAAGVSRAARTTRPTSSRRGSRRRARACGSPARSASGSRAPSTG
jgi:hypothetical protein